MEKKNPRYDYNTFPDYRPIPDLKEKVSHVME